MRVTIFGATGLLGKALLREWKEDEVTGFGSADGDIRDAEQVMHLVQTSRPDWIVLAAAYTDVDGCETNRDLALNVNCRGAVNVAQVAKQQGARLLLSAPTTSLMAPSRLPTLPAIPARPTRLWPVESGGRGAA